GTLPIIVPSSKLSMSTARSHTHYPTLFSSTDPAPTALSPLSLHDALPISPISGRVRAALRTRTSMHTRSTKTLHRMAASYSLTRSEEHTSELQSLAYLVCRLLLEKKKIINGVLFRFGVEFVSSLCHLLLPA